MAYTVTNVNWNAHTSRICDSVSGREKVVHRNLLLLAYFLLLENNDDTPDHVSSVSGMALTSHSDAGTVCDTEDEGVADVTSPGASSGGLPDTMDKTPSSDFGSVFLDTADRTVAWVTQLTEPSLSQGDVGDVSSVVSVQMDLSVLSVGAESGQAVPCAITPGSMLL